MNKAVVAIAAVAGLGVCVAGAAAYSGRAVTSRLEQQARDVTQALPIAKIVKEEKKSGLFSSTYDITMRFGCFPADPQQAAAGVVGPVEPIELTFHNVIKHGPLPGGKLGLAAIDSEILLPEKWQKRAQEALGNQPILKAETTINFQGEYQSEFALPVVKLSRQKGSFELKPIKGTASGKSVDKGPSRYQVHVPSIDAVVNADDKTFTFKVANIRSQGEVNTTKSMWLAPGESTATIDGITFTGVFPDPDSGATKPFDLTFNDFKASGKNVLDNTGLFSSSSNLSMKGKLNTFVVDKVELSGAMKRIHAATYQHLMQELVLGSFSCDPQKRANPTAQLDVLMKDGVELLKHNPEYGLDKLGVVLDGKDASLSYSVGTEGVTSTDMMLGVPFMLLQKGVLKASFTLHTALLQDWVDRLTKLAADPNLAGQVLGQGAPAPSSQMVNELIDQAVAAGYVVRQGDHVSSQAEFRGGQLKVNGKDIALPALGLP